MASDVLSPDGAQAYIDRAVGTHHFLRAQTDLSPRNSDLNRTLSAFVHETLRERPADETREILQSPAIENIAPSLRRLLGQSEYEMECYAARAMVGNVPNAPKEYGSYRDFIYYDNYMALIESELKAMKWDVKCPPLKADRESIAFVGAGPLPISAIMLALRTGLKVTCLDSDPEACRLGRNLIRFLAATDPGCKNLDKQISYLNKAGEEHDYATHPVVFIASLVPRKDPVMMRIIWTSHTAATVVTRSAEGLSTLLYQAEECRAGQEFYNSYLTGKSQPCSKAINTSLISKLPPGKMFPKQKIDFLGWGQDGLDCLKPRGRHMPRLNPHEL